MAKERIQESLPRFGSIRVLVPGTGPRFRCGGLSVALQTARLLSELRPTEVVTYRAREQSHPFLDDLLAQEKAPGNAMWLVSWGFDVPRLLKRLRGRLAMYQAHSSGYGFDLPPGVPVLAVSRNTLGYWGDRAPRNPLFFIPNALEPQWFERGNRDLEEERRPIDVLVQQRKSSDYVLGELVPTLRSRGLKVEVQADWVDDLVTLFNNSTIYLYDSADYWRSTGVSEGFGLPPLEATACGCVVFSSLNHALADVLTPGESVHQLGCGSVEHDVERIVAAATHPQDWRQQPLALEAMLRPYGETKLTQRWQKVLTELDKLMPSLLICRPLISTPSWALRWKRRMSKFHRVVNRLPGWLKAGCKGTLRF